MTGPRRSLTLHRWVVYIIACADESLYTGITTDMSRRMEEHAAGTGAKYTKRRGPFALRYTEHHATRSAALKREAAIKSMDRPAKLALIATLSGRS
jgi:putative endonuclease